MPVIKDIEIFELGENKALSTSPWSSTILLLRMTTSDGIVGYGQAPTTLMTLPVLEELRELARIYKGKEVTEIKKNYMEVYKHSFYLPVSMETTSALSAFEIASWDIVGKLYGMPVYDAFGGAMRDKVRAYANGWYDNCVSPDDFVEKAKIVRRMGFTAIKFDPWGDAYDTLDNKHIEHARAIVGALRSTFKDLDLLIEFHGRFSANAAIKGALALEEFKPMFIEEPVHPDQFEGLLKLREKVSTPIALGERVLNRTLFLKYLVNNVVDILQPDITNFGGLMQGREVAALAESFGAEMAYHDAFGPVQTVATLHLDYAIPNFLIQESFDAFAPEWKKKLLKSGLTLEDGYLKLDKGKPGLGISIDERILDEFKVSGMEPFNPNEPTWVVGGTFKNQ
ncbi:MAG: mandelate racemase/muconate lactonizing enzyme family protein [Thermoplasmatales archaeon]